MNQPTFSNLKTFLNAHRCEEGKSSQHTHTRIGNKNENIFGGSYFIPDDKMQTFMDLYYEEVFEKGQPEYLTEKQLTCGPIMVDFDFRYNTSIKSRQHVKGNIIELVQIYNEHIRDLLNIPSNDSYEVYILEKPHVNCLEDKTKDGIHMVICLNMERSDQILLRKMVLEEKDYGLKYAWQKLPLINDFRDVIDEGVVSAKCNWQMFGSCKPLNETYAITHGFIVGENYENYEEIPLKESDQKELFFKISARNPNHKTYPINNKVERKRELDSGCSSPTPIAKKISSASVNVAPTDDKFIDLLFNVIRNDVVNGNKVINRSNGYWYKICGALLSNSYDKQVWLDYCNPRSDPMNDTASKLWDNMAKAPRTVSIYTLVTIAKLVNLNGYNEWVIKYKQYISLKTLLKGENDIAEKISHKLKEVLVFCDEKWYLNDSRTKLWMIVKDPKAIVVSYIQRSIDESKESLMWKINRTDDNELKEKLKKFEAKYFEHYQSVCKCGTSSQILSLLKTYLRDNEFYLKLDVQPFKIAYQNGILNLKTLKFKNKIDSSDFLTHTIPYKYEEGNEDDIKWVEEQIKKICNYNDKHLAYYLSILGYTFTGDSSRKQEFYCLRGQGANNGKSFMFEVLTVNASNYTGKMESKIFETTYGSRHKTIAMWGGKRLMWINELSKKKQEAEIIKEVSDGKPVEFQKLYGTMGRMPIGFKLFIVGNHTIKYDDDNGMNRRLKILQLDSDFDEQNKVDDYINRTFIRDDNLFDLFTGKYKHALMGLIFKYSKMYVDDGYKLKAFPEEWDRETKETIKGNNTFKDFFDDNFDIIENAEIGKEDVEHILGQYKEHDKINLKDELKKMKIPFSYDCMKRIDSSSKKGIWRGFRASESMASMAEE